MRTNDKQLGPRADLHRQLHADRSRRTGVDSFFDHLHICVKSLERVFSSLKGAGSIGQLDVSLVADLKQLRMYTNTVGGQDTSGRVNLYGDLRHRCSFYRNICRKIRPVLMVVS